jgi:hypothetical protein
MRRHGSLCESGESGRIRGQTTVSDLDRQIELIGLGVVPFRPAGFTGLGAAADHQMPPFFDKASMEAARLSLPLVRRVFAKRIQYPTTSTVPPLPTSSVRQRERQVDE